jgi:hypothetical protein
VVVLDGGDEFDLFSNGHGGLCHGQWRDYRDYHDVYFLLQSGALYSDFLVGVQQNDEDFSNHHVR